MPISIKSEDEYNVIIINGDFDAHLATEARQKFGEVVNNTDRNVKMDLSEVEFIDSSGIGAIVFLYKRLRCAGFDLLLDNLQEQPYELLTLLRINKIIETRKLL